MEKAFSLKGEIALITGGGSGLGLGMAECFVKAGARVVLVGRRTDVLKAAAKKLGKNASWRDAVMEYKSYNDPNDPQMKKFDRLYERLKKS